MRETRAFTPIEKAVTDLVTEFSKVQDAAKQVDKLEEFIEHVMTARELLSAADNPELIKSTRLELIVEATNLISVTIKDLGAQALLASLERFRVECADKFIKVTEEKSPLPTRALGVDEQVLEC
jgi:PP-loop superfamily ATP-utilizing enzyme